MFCYVGYIDAHTLVEMGSELAVTSLLYIGWWTLPSLALYRNPIYKYSADRRWLHRIRIINALFWRSHFKIDPGSNQKFPD